MITVRQLFIIILIFGYNNILHAQQFVVENIVFEGLQRIDIKTALSNIPVCIGDILDSDDFSKIIKSLFATGKFENIQVLNIDNSILVKVIERPVIANITFHGNEIIQEDVLKDILELQNIRIGSMLNSFAVIKAEKDLNDFYYSIGKFQAIIRIIVTSLVRNRVNLKVVCNEGKSSKIKQININGNYDFNNHQLLSNFQFYNAHWWWSFIKHDEYQNQKLFNDLYFLRNFYLSKGYARFNICSTQINLTPSKDDVYVTLYVNEGVKYVFSDIVIKCHALSFFPQINKLVNINKGELYNNLRIERIKNDIKCLLGNNGYIYPNISINEKIDDFNKEVELEILIDIGNKFYVRKIIFEGNYLTQDKVLRQEMKQIEGTCYNNNFVEQGKERLERLGYFDVVEIQVERISDISDQVDVIYRVKERNTGSMNVNLGMGTESGINFQFGIQEENWLGTGNIFSFNGVKNNYQIYTEFSMFNPYFTIGGVSLGGKLFYNDFNANHTELADYDLKSYGVDINIGFPIREYHSLNLGIDYVYNNLSSMKPQVVIWRYLKTNDMMPKIMFNTQFDTNLNFSVRDVFLVLGWHYNRLNRGYFPTCGVCARFSSKITTPGSDNEYLKIIYDSDCYVPLNSDATWVLMHRIRIGHSIGMHNKDTPFYDNFYAGGVNSIRGFRSNTVGPKAAYYKFNGNDSNYDECTIENSSDAIGGNAIAVIKGELIVPMPFSHLKNIGKIVRTSLFLDIGSVWDTVWRDTVNTRAAGILNYSSSRNVRISSGIAIQWLSPFGPVILSYAQLHKKYAGDQLEQFQFNIGKTW
ncbi:Outer membrane protein assembly factor BamA [Blochmannia endosymbiont of Camponotus (Colobopsis) obliquus]|nr:Outer membrane protein assembly factor BamA [Blochmannia endosymbiont of Camponotus (Colobopsis) obliquus]